MSKALILRILGWHLLGSTTAIMLPSIPTYGVTCLLIDSHIQRIVVETEETTVTQQVSHTPTQRHRGHKELRPSTGPKMVKARYSNQQGLHSRRNLCWVQPTENIGNLSASRRCLCLGTKYSLYCWGAASVSESEFHATVKTI